MADVEFELDRAGVREIFKSEGMGAAVLEAAQKLADRANEEAWACHGALLGIDSFHKPPYAAHADLLSNTYVGAAHTNGKMGRLDWQKFQTLDHVNH